MLVWLGPSPVDYQSNLALKLLGDYLTASATSPMQKAFIEIPKPFATSISFYASDRMNKNELQCYIADVPTKHLNNLGDMVKSKMAEIAKTQAIDMDRMGIVLRRDKRKLLNYMETNVTGVLEDAIIGGTSGTPYLDCANDRLLVR
jgi:Zn-dependent M16 (insulinase) family peptidase